VAYESKSVGLSEDFTRPLRIMGHLIAPVPRASRAEGRAEDRVAAARTLPRNVAETILRLALGYVGVLGRPCFVAVRYT